MNICFVAPRFPFPTTKGDTLRAYHQIRELSQNHTVHLIAATESPPSVEAQNELLKYCHKIDIVAISKLQSYAMVAMGALVSRLPLQVLYFRAPALRAAVMRAVTLHRFDIIHAMTIRIAPAVLDISNIPVVIDFIDSYVANIATRRERVGPLIKQAYDFEFPRISQYERAIAQHAAGGMVIAELDREAIGDTNLAILPNGVDLDSLSYYDGERDPATIIFTGNMGYQPNIDAATWFAAECWPTLRERIPNLRLSIVGARPAASVTALSKIPGIDVVGPVESMLPYLHRATIAICPIRCGSGMQNKILEAMSAGTPVVTTAFANLSIGADPNQHVKVSRDNDPNAFIDAVVDLLANPLQAKQQAASARTFVESAFAWSHRTTQLLDIYKVAIERHAQKHKTPV